MTPLERARNFIVRGFNTVPIPHRQKKPVLPNWPNLRIGLDDAAQYFNGQQMNIGIILGEPWNLTDVDVDAREALWAAPEFLPETGWMHGRHSKPASHAFYWTDEAVLTERLKDPLVTSEEGCLIEIRSFKSDGSVGLQTVAPGSIHPSGELVEFTPGFAGDPAKVERILLVQAVHRIGACALLGRYAPGDGRRHDFFLALAGMLAHAKWTLEDACRVGRALYRILWGARANLGAAEREVESTYQRYDDGHEITGIPHLKEMFDERVLPKALEWLEIEGPPRARAGKTEQPKTKPKFQPAAPYLLHELRDRNILMPTPLVTEIIVRPSLYIIAGAAKSGKTVLAVQLGMSVASGLALFDNYSAAQTNVLLIEQDDPNGETALKDFLLKTRAARPQAPFYCLTNTEFELGDEFTAWLRQKVQQLKLGLVILDSLTTLRAARAGQTDFVKAETAELRQLADLAHELGIVIVLIHHYSKSSAHLHHAMRAAGSFAVGAATGALLTIDRFDDLLPGDTARRIQIEGHGLGDKLLVVRFLKDSLDFSFVMEGPASEKYPDIRRLHMAFSDRPFGAKEVTSEVGWSRPTVYRVCDRLVMAGVLVKLGTQWMWNPQFSRRDL